MNRSCILMLLAFPLAVGCGGGDRDQATLPGDDAVLARVAATPITQYELNATVTRNFGEAGASAVGAEARRKMLDGLVTSRALALAREGELSTSARAELEREVAVYREELLVKQYLAAHAPPEPVSPEMIKEYYDKHPERFGGEQVRRYELLASERELSRVERDALIKALSAMHGEQPFAARVEALRARGLPIVYSTGSGNEQVLHPRLRSLIAALGPNQSSDLTFLEQRAYLARVVSVEQLPPKPLSEVREEIRETLRPVQIKKALQKVRDRVVKTTVIEYTAR